MTHRGLVSWKFSYCFLWLIFKLQEIVHTDQVIKKICFRSTELYTACPKSMDKIYNIAFLGLFNIKFLRMSLLLSKKTSQINLYVFADEIKFIHSINNVRNYSITLL